MTEPERTEPEDIELEDDVLAAAAGGGAGIMHTNLVQVSPIGFG